MTNPDLHRRATSVFREACELQGEARRALLDQRCEGDPALRAEVESLLRHDAPTEAASGFGSLDSGGGASFLASVLARDAESEPMPERIGRYRIVRELGRGGMGIVYEAEQESPRRRVALKVVRLALASGPALRRFGREAHLLGQLQHPGIAQVFEAGSAQVSGGACPYFVMEFVDGKTLDAHVREQGLAARDVLELMARVCDAVQHAHQKGIIHRDLKPGNILVRAESTSGAGSEGTASGTVIDRLGQPKVLDFGIARTVDADAHATMQTNAGQIVGTLSTMAPEQLEGDSNSLDTRCDVYAIGAMLYQLLAGRPALELSGKPVAEAARVIREQEPARLGQVDALFRGDVETIVGKAMAKDRERRYASASELGEDIRRYLRHEPIVARPAGAVYHASKFAQRNRGLVAGVGVALIALVGGVVGTSMALRSAIRSRGEAERTADTMARVAAFQGAILDRVDLAGMGDAMLADLLREMRPGEATLVEAGGVATGTLDRLASGVNPTNLARSAIEGQIIEATARAIDAEFPDEPLLRADLHGSLGLTCNALAMFGTGARETERCYRLRLEHLGERDPKTIEALNNMTSLMVSSGRNEEALPYCRESYRLSRLVPDLPDDAPFQSALALGTVLGYLGRGEEGRGYLLEAIEGFESQGTGGEPALITTMNLLASLEGRAGRYDEALALYDRALVIYERNPERDRSRRLMLLMNRGWALRALGRPDEAEGVFREVVPALRTAFGDDDERTLVCLGRLADVLADLGQTDEARALFTEQAERAARVLGPDHPLATTPRRRLGELGG